MSALLGSHAALLGSVIERLGRHLSDELIMFPQGNLQFRKNGFRFGLLAVAALAQSSLMRSSTGETCTTSKAQAFPGVRAIESPGYGEGSLVAA